MQSYPLVNPIPGLLLSKSAERGCAGPNGRVGRVCDSNTANDLKDYLVISLLMEFMRSCSIVEWFLHRWH